MNETPQQALVRLAGGQGVSLAALSRMLDRNPAYLQQYIGRGSPRLLPERDRARLADFFGVDEAALGGPHTRAADVRVPYLDLSASAGPGRAAGVERIRRHEVVAHAALAQAGMRAGDASMIDVAGDSMAPLLLHGDRVLVDRAATRLSATGHVFVMRIDDDVLIKRASLADGLVRVASDNPAYSVRLLPPAAVSVIGRARLLLRAL